MAEPKADAAAAEFAAENARIYAEYDAAMADVRGNPNPSPLAKARADRAMEALRAHRQLVREAGQYAGHRPLPPEGSDLPPDKAVGLRIADHEPESAVPSL